MTKMASTCGHVSTFFTSVQSVNEIYIIIKRLSKSSTKLTN